jgi:tetratricopeptide (TPR) repeat protein
MTSRSGFEKVRWAIPKRRRFWRRSRADRPAGSDAAGKQPVITGAAELQPSDAPPYTGPIYVDEVERLTHGTETEREEALQRLAERVESRPDDSVGRSDHALGLAAVGRHTEAIAVFESLVEAEPDSLLFRMNLATTLSKLRHFQLARAHVRHVAEYAADESDRAYAREQLEILDRALLADEENERLAELRRRREIGSIDEEGRVLLVRRLMRRLPRDREEDLAEEATAVLEEGLDQSQDAVALLELLVVPYLRHDPDKRLDRATARLERLAPNSSVLDILGGNLELDAAAPISPDRVNELMGSVMGDDPVLREAAVEDLGAIVASYPGDPYRHSAYAFALCVVGRFDEARRQAERAARDAGEDHVTHFHIGQVLSWTGDKQGAQHHLDLAWRFARNDDDRRDVASVLASYSSSD